MRVLNKKYWSPELQLRLDDLRVNIDGTNDQWYDRRDEWCKKNLPKDQWCSFVETFTNRKVFAFKDKADIVAFKLRWK